MTTFKVIASVIKKQELMHYLTPENPYELAVLLCMERLNNFLLENNQAKKSIQIQFEARGKNENKKLKLEFRRICESNFITIPSKADFSQIDYHIGFLDKKSNSAGLQIADLIARPIGLHTIRPKQQNRAFEVIEKKLIRNDDGNYEERGLKVFP